jgi:hypothetical protein
MTEHILTLRRHLRFGMGAGAIKILAFTALVFALPAQSAEPCPPIGIDAEGGSVVSAGTSCPGPTEGSSETRNYRDPVSGVKLLIGRTTINVSNSSQLASALGAATCGQTIQLAPGSYSGSFRLSASCPANNPVIVRGAEGFASVVNGEFYLQGSRNILTGIFLSGSSAGVSLGGENNKFVGNKITGWGGQCTRNAVSVQQYASYAEIAYNEIYRPGAWSSSCDFQLRMGIRTSDNTEADFPYDGWVHHNYLHDFPQKPVPNDYRSGQDDAIEIGQTQGGRMPLVNSRWYIERNRIENHAQGHGTVDLKVGGVVYRHNTFMNTPGRVDSRGSTLFGSIIESNYHRNSGGSTIHGKDHKIVCNDFNSVIVLKAGDVACDAVNPGQNKHAHVCDVLVSGNRASLNIGKVDSSDETLAASNTTVRAHVGGITLGLQSGMIDQRTSAPSYQCSPATETTTNMVGPNALSSASADYKDARGL